MSARPRRAAERPLLLLASVLALLAAPLAAQEPGVPPVTQGVVAGARVGIDYFTDAPVLGVQMRVLPDPWGIFELMPNAELTLGRGDPWQINLDGVVQPTRGLYLGGGAAFRNSLYEEEVGRETRAGYSIFAGLRPPAERGEINPQVEMRWTFVGDFARPRTITVGANWPLLLW